MEASMHLNLSDEDARTLGTLLRDYLPQLRMEVARTEAREFRHEMVKRQEVCERVLAALERRADDAAGLPATEGL
jgi:hypothetical protein